MDPCNLNLLKELTGSIHCGDLDALTQFLRNGGDPNAHYGMSLLSQACSIGNLEMVRLLLRYGSNPNFSGKTGKLPLYIGSRNQKPESLEIMELLIANGANVNCKYVNGSTPLLEAVWANDEVKTEMLIKAGANVFESTNAGETGLHISAMKGNIRVMKMFLEAGLPPNIPRSKGPASVLHTGTQPLHLTVVSPNGGHVNAAELLLSVGADVDAAEWNGRTALHLAAIRNAYHVVDVLIAYGCNLELVSMENDEQKTPLMKAIDLGHHTVVDRLIAAGANLETTDHYGITPLVTAVFTGKPIVVKLLLQAGCDANQPTTNGTLPFQISLKHPPHITEMLVLTGCRVPEDFATLATRDFPLANYPSVLDWLLFCTCNPPSLQLCCRNVIRCALGFRPAEKLSQLSTSASLPFRIKQFILCQDLDDVLVRYGVIAKRT